MRLFGPCHTVWLAVACFDYPESFFSGKEKHININKYAGLFRDWVGAKNLFMCFFRVIPYGGEKAHKQNAKKTGQSREHFAYVFFSLCVCVCVFSLFSVVNYNRLI